MKFLNWNKTIGWLMMLLVSSCVEPYSPEVLEGPNSYLVVNGFINTNGPTTVQLIRTQNLKDETPPPAEINAIVQIESEEGENYRLWGTGNGNYTSSNLELNPASKYRLYIRTANGKEYASEYVTVKRTPAIDEITWEPIDDEVQVYVNTHDPNNDTRYYRWEFEETWHYRAAFGTGLKYVNGKIELRDRNDPDIYNCWTSDNSTTIELGTSIRLTQDVISNYKLTAIPYDSEKIAIKYSILVKQYALTREAYAYWETLKKNTENIGTLFDPLPSQLTGNIKSLSDPNEPVIGYVTASTMQQKRIFIGYEELPREWKTFIPRCPIDTMLLAISTPREYFEGGYVMPVYEVYPPEGGGMFPIGYSYATVDCVDCRTRGTNVKPDFWE